MKMGSIQSGHVTPQTLNQGIQTTLLQARIKVFIATHGVASTQPRIGVANASRKSFGLNPQNVFQSLNRSTGNPRGVWDLWYNRVPTNGDPTLRRVKGRNFDDRMQAR
eukprot:snap_masked-scaffold_17-processed-gene-2.31-mRNA-1 protein AED:0.41 eAED:0.41 QI:0/0/0/1/1/1/2/0/107